MNNPCSKSCEGRSSDCHAYCDSYKLYAEEQELLFQWAELQSHKYPSLRLMFHIPNGRIVELALHSKKARIRKKNMKRVMNYYYKHRNEGG